MKKTTYFIALASMLAIFFSMEGCYYDNIEELYPVEATPIDSTVPLPTWTDNVSGIVQASCSFSSGCHASGSSVVNLTSYDQVKGAIENNGLRDQVATGAMPQGSSLAAADKDALLTWIDNGYLNN